MLLRSVLAWRIQTNAFGGLNQQIIKLLHNAREPREPIVAPGTSFTHDGAENARS